MMTGLPDLIGKMLPLSNGWGLAEVCGGWTVEGIDHVLLAWPSADNPKQLFNERITDVIKETKK